MAHRAPMVVTSWGAKASLKLVPISGLACAWPGHQAERNHVRLYRLL